MARRRRGTILLAFALLALVAGGCGSGGSGGSKQPPRPAKGNAVWVGTYLNTTAPAGSFRACVEDGLRQGLPLARVTERCAKPSGGRFGDSGPSSRPGGGTLQRPGSKQADIECAQASFSPIAADGGTGGGVVVMTDPALEARVRALEEELARMKLERAQAEAARKLQEAIDASNAADKPSGRDPSPGGGGGTGPAGRTDPGAVETCSGMAAFFAECNRNGWTSHSCKDFQARKDGCGDPAVTNPNPDNPDACSDAKNPEVDGKTAERAIMLHCYAIAKPVPGEAPCAQIAVGELNSYHLRRDHGDATPCGNPKALTGEDQCAGTVTIATFGARTLQDAIRDLQRHLGGPIFVVSAGPQPGPRPEPGPE